MRSLVFALIAITGNAALATMTMNQGDFSNYFYTSTTNGTTPVIYAGMTSNNTSCTQDNVHPCDSCAAQTGALSANSFCSTNEIYPNLAFNVTVRTDSQSDIAQSPQLYFKIGSSAFLPASQPALAINTPLQISTTWGAICGAAGSSGCTGSFASQTLTVGFSTDGGSTFLSSESVQFMISFRYVASSVYTGFGCTASASTFDGICGFTVYPGDKKVYVLPSEPHPTSSFAVGDFSGGAPSTTTQDASGMTIAAIRMFYLVDPTNSNAAYGVAPANTFSTSLPYQDLAFTFSTSSFSFDKKVTSLTNNFNYYFIAATVDQAGIATLFTDPSVLTATFSSGTYGTEQATTPQPVYGLLDNQNCFIATAAYGSIFAPEVDNFRKFRNQFLLPTKIGRLFVSTYYKYSPPFAAFIAQSEILRFAARILLTPFLIIVRLSLWLGLIPTLTLLVLLIFGIVFGTRRRRAN